MLGRVPLTARRPRSKYIKPRVLPTEVVLCPIHFFPLRSHVVPPCRVREIAATIAGYHAELAVQRNISELTAKVVSGTVNLSAPTERKALVLVSVDVHA